MICFARIGCGTPIQTVCLALLLCLLALPARAWPERTVTIVAPFAAGGGVDLTARIAARFLDRHSGGRGFVVVNRPGASGEVGWAAALEAPADGHTIALLNLPSFLSVPIERPARFRLDDFSLVANLVDDPVTISVQGDSPYRNLGELVAAMRANPGGVSYGSSGIGASGHIAMLMFGEAAGVTGLHVPFTGAAPAAAALLGRQIDTATATFAEISSFLRGGANWRVLAVLAPARLAAMPALPTAREQGVALDVGSIRGLGVARATPPDVLAAIVAATARMNADPDYQAALLQANLPPRYLNAADYAALLRETEARLRALWATNPWNR